MENLSSATSDRPNTSHHRVLPVIEVFGPVIQGEGAMAGRQTMFVRLGGCDYRCVWCDSLYAVDPYQVKANRAWMTPMEVVNLLMTIAPHCDTVTISGGNPCIHDLSELISCMRAMFYFIAIETQGTICPLWIWRCDQITISPKPPSSGMITDFLQLDSFIRECRDATKVSLKVVVFTSEDMAYAKGVHLRYPEIEFWIQPGTSQYTHGCNPPIEAIRADILDRTEMLANSILSDPQLYRVKLMPQLHSLIYGIKRGV